MGNRHNHEVNKSMLTGRHGGNFYENGQPRGGGSHVVDQYTFTRFEPVLLSPEDVVRNLGLVDGNPLPWEQRSAAVTPVEMVHQDIYEHGTVHGVEFPLDWGGQLAWGLPEGGQPIYVVGDNTTLW